MASISPNKFLRFTRIAMIILGIVFVIMGVSLYWVNFVFVWSFGVSGILVILIAQLFLKRLEPLSDEAKEKVRKSWKKTRALVHSVQMNNHFRMGVTRPYQIYAIAINPFTKEKMMIKSENIWFDPSSLVRPKQELDLYVNPKNPKKYFLDIEKIREASQRRASDISSELDKREKEIEESLR